MMAVPQIPHVLICSGFDPLGGAGVLADVAVTTEFGCRAFAVPTSLVVQDTRGVRSSAATDHAAFFDAVETLMGDVPIHAVKIGVVDCEHVAEGLRAILADFGGPVVIDPVLAGGTSERPSLGPSGALNYRALRGIADVFTPNEEETRSLLMSEATATGVAQPALSAGEAATRLAKTWALHVLQTGGHSQLRGTDVLAGPDGTMRTFAPSSVIEDADVHGTGCHLSSAVTALLALGHSLPDAVRKAKSYMEYLLTELRVAPGRGREQLYHDDESRSVARKLATTRD